MDSDSLARVTAEIVDCFACPRLVAWRERVATEKRASFKDEPYWGRPVPGFGDPMARLLVVGLAPAAHGGNRTGRVFTGDRSGDWVYAALHRAGFANQPTSVHRGDGLQLRGAYVSAAVRCAPPDNKPTPAERDTCQPYLERELALLGELRVIVALGRFGFEVLCRMLGVRPKPPFGHGAEVQLPDRRWMICSYHPSQQNT
ncbi:MAG: uracil-DNA glycosylase, partial [Actinomycetota bacterium]|nr:uracil-DNA glycosylase [Actinomycetota bacterium]